MIKRKYTKITKNDRLCEYISNINDINNYKFLFILIYTFNK